MGSSRRTLRGVASQKPSDDRDANQGQCDFARGSTYYFRAASGAHQAIKPRRLLWFLNTGSIILAKRMTTDNLGKLLPFREIFNQQELKPRERRLNTVSDQMEWMALVAERIREVTNTTIPVEKQP